MPDVAQCIEPRLADAERLLSDNTIRVSTLNLTHLLLLNCQYQHMHNFVIG